MTTRAALPLTQPQLLDLYRQMLLIRLTEEQLARARQRGLVHGACHTYVGQEAIAAGVSAHLRADDVVFSTHRGHGHALAKGVSPRELIAELLGRATGCSRGRGGSMHLFAPEVGMMGTSGIVGPAILQAAGGGYSFKILKTDQVAVAYFGDGASNNGAFHEGLNMASIWKLPVLFVCENNQYATEVPFSYASGNSSVAARAAAYGLPGFEIDGNDVLAVHSAAGAAIARARAGQGATLLECKTYRTRPHAEGMDDYTYRTREEVEAWRSRCPIGQFRQLLLDETSADGAIIEEAQLDAIDAQIKQLVEEAQQFAEASPYPEAAAATTHIFSEREASRETTREASPRSPARDNGASTTPRQGAREINFMQATLEALTGEMARNPRIFVLGEGIGKRGGNFKTTDGLYDRFGADRLCDTPICERGLVGLGAGAAMTGSRPVIDFMFVDFLLDGLGELFNQVAKMQYMSSGRLTMPILLRGCIGIGHSAATHHSGSYYSLFANIPGMRVVVPSNPHDAKGLLLRALRSDDPVMFLEHRELMAVKGPVPIEDYEIEFGRAAVVRSGSDVTVVALAIMVGQALQAAEQLATEGIDVEVIDPRTIAPLDMASILESVRKTGRLLIVDQAFGPCGVGAEIAAAAADEGFDLLDAPIRRLNGAHTPTPYSPTLEAAIAPNVASIVAALRALAAEEKQQEGDVMAIEISIPPLGWSSDDAIFAGWIKADGATIAPGDAIYNVETEKATQEIESLDGGKLCIIADGPKVGERLPVGTVIGYLLSPGEAPPVGGRPVDSPSNAGEPVAQIFAKENGAAMHSAGAGHGRADDAQGQQSQPIAERRPTISPRAKRTATDLGIDWTQLAGSGSTGRIRERDVLAAAESQTPAPALTAHTAQHANQPLQIDTEFERTPITGVRRTIAERMMIGGKSTAPVTLTSTTDATNLVNLRGQFQAASATSGEPVPSYTDFLSKLTALALVEHPVLNARWDGDHILVFKQVHLGIAVDTSAGLVVPVIRDAARLSLAALVAGTRDLVDRARQRRLSLPEMQGGTFTVSNLGGFGIDAFTPIINHPEAAVLGVGRIRREPAAFDNQIALRDMLTLSLTFDHRIVDGAPAARFLQTLCEYVRNPGPRLIG